MISNMIKGKHGKYCGIWLFAAMLLVPVGILAVLVYLERVYS